MFNLALLYTTGPETRKLNSSTAKEPGPRWHVPVLVALAFLVYANSLFFGFVWDDNDQFLSGYIEVLRKDIAEEGMIPKVTGNLQKLPS